MESDDDPQQQSSDPFDPTYCAEAMLRMCIMNVGRVVFEASVVRMNPQNRLTRRELLRTAALGMVSAPFLKLAARAKQREFVEPARVPYAGSDDSLLDEIERTAFEFFWNEAGPTTGQVKDRAVLRGRDTHTVASVAATGR